MYGKRKDDREKGYFMKKLYLIHQYGEPSHFKALYDHAQGYGFSASDQIILSYGAIAWRTRDVLRKEGAIKGLKFLAKTMFDHFKLFFLRGEILIVGIAPYDHLLNRYKRIFMNNRSYYFTSQTKWDGTDIPRGDIKNKKIFEDLLGLCFDGAFCVSEASAKQMKRFFKKISVVNHAIDHDKYKKRTDIIHSTRKYVFVGQYIDRKNIELMLRWLEENPKEMIEFSFIGKGKNEPKIDEMTQKDKRVVNCGYYTKEKLQESLSEYDFLVLPSKDEPYGIVLLEALSAGVPCIVSNTIGPNEIIMDGVTGLIFDVDVEEDYDRVMKKSIRLDIDELNKMKQNAVKEGRKYDTKEIIKKWVCLLETVDI